ncbi:hypothetical protein EVAR_62450_1 [Eumeta japonica]|uniref:POU domain, class 6, transcription factor 2 n=1 Tax=Eumeta variegata TaxID=151549 RepID=A0A4C1YY06_EUMVA|nr:hypothetical protein EVAR_62450_1 [Eumeta japonica]
MKPLFTGRAGGVGSPTPVGGGSMLPPGMPSPMPQLILASGQLIQGIQGAQLLIPTSQGIATQTILTIPVNHVNSNDQIVNLALNNGQVVSTSLANLQAMAQPHQLLSSSPQQSSNLRQNMMNPNLPNSLLNPGLPNFLSNGASNAQELLQALQQPQGNHSLLQTVQNVPQQMPGRRSSSPRPERHYKDRENFERFAGGSRDRNDRENVGVSAMNSINSGRTNSKGNDPSCPSFRPYVKGILFKNHNIYVDEIRSIGVFNTSSLRHILPQSFHFGLWDLELKPSTLTQCGLQAANDHRHRREHNVRDRRLRVPLEARSE